MSRIDAIYQQGVFKPLGHVALSDNQRVSLSIEPVEDHDVSAWLDEVRRFHRRIIAEQGLLPDSTPEIAADRMR